MAVSALVVSVAVASSVMVVDAFGGGRVVLSLVPMVVVGVTGGMLKDDDDDAKDSCSRSEC